MKRIAAVAAATALMAIATPTPAHAGNNKHAICHYDQSGKYHFQSISWKAINDNGHRAQHEKDIIPPYVYDDVLIFEGQNWTEWGQSVFNNGCEIDDLPEVGSQENLALLAVGGVAFLGAGWYLTKGLGRRRAA